MGRQGDKGTRGTRRQGGRLGGQFLSITHYLLPITYSQCPMPNTHQLTINN
ncbi:hypothetical protein PI95_005220 [Hassallia byssoidea VB512170]|uniref:Uncharacterized protein n=1 Tax=Hassallia byssoidea VB512170 TaxID=1304833 RepID=A0A846H5Z0_9CYAN|nr:hypothetical protein [Hassalia byssoidea]NEU71991.1 hypothetical protein [Hassalia byssoidea VB512170]